MPLAAIPAAVWAGAAGAGASLVGSKMVANSANNAAQAQTQSANQALALEREIYNQNAQRVQPYVNAGYTSLNNLMQQFGGGQNFPQQVASQLAPFQGAIGMQAQIPQGQPQPMAQAQPQGMPQLYRVQAPTGEIAMLSQPQAQAAVQRGARILNAGGPMAGGGRPMPGGASLASLGQMVR